MGSLLVLFGWLAGSCLLGAVLAKAFDLRVGMGVALGILGPLGVASVVAIGIWSRRQHKVGTWARGPGPPQTEVAAEATPPRRGPPLSNGLRWAFATFVFSTGWCFGGSMGPVGAVLIVMGVLTCAAVLLLGPRPRGSRLPRWDSSDLVAQFAAGAVPFVSLGFGGLTFAVTLLLMVAIVPVVVMWLIRLVVDWRTALTRLAMASVFAGSAVLLLPHAMTLRRWQVQLAESHLRSQMADGNVDGEFNGVYGWIWIPYLLDGGQGVAYDPSRRLTHDDFAAEAWWAITLDQGKCERLYDNWYWCV